MKHNRKAERLTAVILQGLGAVFAVPILVLCIVRGAVEYGARTVAVVKRAAALAVALDDHLAGLLARRAGAELYDIL